MGKYSAAYLHSSLTKTKDIGEYIHRTWFCKRLRHFTAYGCKMNHQELIVPEMVYVLHALLEIVHLVISRSSATFKCSLLLRLVKFFYSL